MDDARMTACLARTEGLIAEHGWAVQAVLPRADDPDPGPPFAYTVGLFSPRFGHPDDERAPLSVANRLYGHTGPVDALQVVWPDPVRRYPWDDDFDRTMRDMQPLLGRRADRLLRHVRLLRRCRGGRR